MYFLTKYEICLYTSAKRGVSEGDKPVGKAKSQQVVQGFSSLE